MLMTEKEYDFILEQLDMNSLTEWEFEFIKSIKQRRFIGQTLTTKQIECLSKIWDKEN